MPQQPEREVPAPGTWVEKSARQAGGMIWQRFVIRTHLVEIGEPLEQTLMPYLQGRVRPRDVVVLGEKVVAIAEGRAVPLDSVPVSPLVRWLSRQVRPLGYGLGLRRPETMAMAVREVGWPRILLAAGAGLVDRVIGRSGDFYRIAGRRVAAIDGPGPSTIPPYNRYIVLAPIHAQALAVQLARRLRAGVAVVDVNDVGAEVLAHSPGVRVEWVRELLRDNPMGQGAEQTPLGVLRPVRREPRRASRWAGGAEEPAAFGGSFIPVVGSGDGSPAG
ncbi:MAG: coenzyme F420-0:L-glutamate ligase [Firmicutes bacterium]|nr:hypothetical protein [Alicyclobacillaceae bacterium]MCL6496539.1 coenzyme F420-0:L-glutamate ligase [Bacillota bacterium]